MPTILDPVTPDYTYNDLVASVGRFLKSSPVTPTIPELIRLAELTLKRKLRLLDSRIEATLASSNDVVALPTDFGVLVDLQVPGAALQPESVGLQHLNAKSVDSGPASLFTLTDSEIRFWPTAPTTVKITYNRTLLPLSASNTSNWLLELAYDAYLYATLLEASPYLMDDERVPMWERKLAGILSDLKAEDDERTWGRGPIVFRRAG